MAETNQKPRLSANTIVVVAPAMALILLACCFLARYDTTTAVGIPMIGSVFLCNWIYCRGWKNAIKATQRED